MGDPLDDHTDFPKIRHLASARLRNKAGSPWLVTAWDLSLDASKLHTDAAMSTENQEARKGASTKEIKKVCGFKFKVLSSIHIYKYYHAFPKAPKMSSVAVFVVAVVVTASVPVLLCLCSRVSVIANPVVLLMASFSCE